MAVATDFFYLTGFAEPDAVLVLGALYAFSPKS